MTTLLDNIQRYYRLDSNGTEEVSAQDGVATGSVTWATGKLNTAYEGTGDTARRVVAPGLDLVGDMSISMWVYPTATSSFAGILTHQLGAGGVATNYHIDWNGNTIALYVTGNATPGAYTLPLNTWSHFVMTRTTAGVVKYWVNAINVLTSGASYPPHSVPTADLWIGGRPDLFGAFPGLIDEVGIWDRILDQYAVTALFGEGTPPDYANFGDPYPELNVNLPWDVLSSIQDQRFDYFDFNLFEHVRGQQRISDDRFSDLYGCNAGAGSDFTIAVFADRLELTFQFTVVLSGPALLPAYWPISTAVPGAPTQFVTSISAVGAVVTLNTTEAKNGVLYTLGVPPAGINNIVGNVPFAGPFTKNYTAIGTAPIVSLAGAQDASHVKVIFSEPVVVSEALIPSNYLITGGAGLTVLEVVQETDQTFVLRTSLQTPGQSYTVTVSNIHDLYGNLI